MQNVKIKLCQTRTEKNENNIRKAIIIKEKKLLHYLINRVEEIENICISG